MKCPKCNTTEGIKWFLRHQAVQEEDDSTDANVITILCTECGYNESLFLESCLDTIFTEWAESLFDLENLAMLFNSDFPQDNFNFENFPKATDEVVEITEEE